MKNNAVILQAVSNPTTTPVFHDMLRLTMQRHAAYALSHNMDYLVHFGTYSERGVYTGSWDKIKLLQEAMERGYEYAFWVDADAAIIDFDDDLRDAFTNGFIGCCEHNANGIPAHLNVGVTFVKNSEETLKFLGDWWDSFPGDPRWLEQGAFNDLAKKYPDLVFKMDDKYNATVNVNMCDNPVVMGWHGIHPNSRFAQMRKTLQQDFIKFKV